MGEAELEAVRGARRRLVVVDLGGGWFRIENEKSTAALKRVLARNRPTFEERVGVNLFSEEKVAGCANRIYKSRSVLYLTVLKGYCKHDRQAPRENRSGPFD